MNAIICHGIKSKENFDKMTIPMCAAIWYPWLQQKLILSGIPTQCPSFTNSWLPARNYATDTDLMNRMPIDDKTILIGHSCGGGMLIKYLTDHPKIKISHLVLVAPFIDPTHQFTEYFNKFEPDATIPNRVGRIDLFYSTDDHYGDWIIKGCEKLEKLWPGMHVHKFTNRNHFSASDVTEFPEVWDILKPHSR
ncbi:hypothetical protein HDR63_01000 [bacterium]|nr:hypothetical protein [bacterium]